MLRAASRGTEWETVRGVCRGESVGSVSKILAELWHGVEFTRVTSPYPSLHEPAFLLVTRVCGYAAEFPLQRVTVNRGSRAGTILPTIVKFNVYSTNKYIVCHLLGNPGHEGSRNCEYEIIWLCACVETTEKKENKSKRKMTKDAWGKREKLQRKKRKERKENCCIFLGLFRQVISRDSAGRIACRLTINELDGIKGFIKSTTERIKARERERERERVGQVWRVSSRSAASLDTLNYGFVRIKKKLVSRRRWSH